MNRRECLTNIGAGTAGILTGINQEKPRDSILHDPLMLMAINYTRMQAGMPTILDIKDNELWEAKLEVDEPQEPIA